MKEVAHKSAVIYQDLRQQTVQKEDLEVTWVRRLPGGALGLKKTEGFVQHKELGGFWLEVGLPMSPEALRGWVASTFNKHLLKEAADKGRFSSGVPNERAKPVGIPQRGKTWVLGQKRWDIQKAKNAKRPLRMVMAFKSARMPERGLWDGDPLMQEDQ